MSMANVLRKYEEDQKKKTTAPPTNNNYTRRGYNANTHARQQGGPVNRGTRVTVQSSPPSFLNPTVALKPPTLYKQPINFAAQLGNTQLNMERKSNLSSALFSGNQSQQGSGYYDGGGGGGFGYAAPTYQPPPAPALPGVMPMANASTLNLPESPNYYQGINTHIANPYGGLENLATQIGNTPYWQNAEDSLNQHIANRTNPYAGLTGDLQDHYSGLNFDVPDYYGNVTPVGYQHYLNLDPTSPDYYSKLQDMIDSGALTYEALSEEEQLRLAEEHAGINVDPQIAALRRYLEQTELDAQAQTGRIQAAYAPVEAALDRREQSQATRDLESSISRGAGRSGAVEWTAAERDQHYTEQLVGEKGKEAAEITAIANQLGLTQRQIQERMVDLEALRGQLTSQELKELRDKEYDRMFHGETWKFEASLNLADRLSSTHQWEQGQAQYVADRLTQIDQFNSEQAMGLGDRRTALDQWMKEMGLAKADRLTALEQWEKNYDLEVAHRTALDDQAFREWEVGTRMTLGDRKYEQALQAFNSKMGLADRTYQQAVDAFSRELQLADRLTQRDIDQMARALDVYDRTQLTPAQQYQLWITIAEVAGVFPDKLPGT